MTPFCLFSAVPTCCRRCRFPLTHRVAIPQNAISNSCRQLVTIIFASEFRHIVLVRKKTALNQHCRRSHVCNHKKLFGLRSSIGGAGPCHQRFLNETGETLTFRPRRVGLWWPRQKR